MSRKPSKFDQCKCGMKDLCRMFGQDLACDEEVPPLDVGTGAQQENTAAGAGKE